ncbi:serine/threonine-protein kinase [Sphingomonas pokkalii]|uniref:serine/threonine-protein kinase n=1 Tax=Sphingomonas pokkalii TaxID=2175090 RepID=UPI001402E80E|nr:serine/threonine-protein kinase [Sphingomonas pokkalii]
MTDREQSGGDRTVVAIEGGAGVSMPGRGWAGRVSASLAPGDVLNGIYRVKRFVARGGMGEVFEGINVESDERVAIKAIRSHLAQDIKVIAMFRKEARVLTQIAHPAIVQYRVLARDPVLELYYIVTDFIDGEPLTAHLNGTHPSVGAIVTLARRLAAGLQAAHDHGAIHRDMSPDNVLLPDGRIKRAKIIDFGIAKSLDVTAETVLGDGFAGKIGYVAPEQFGDYDRQVGPWTDVYSTALVLLAYARGKPPPMGTSLADAVERRRQRPDFDGLPPLLEPLFRQMLAPDPAERIRSMAEVLAFLDALELPEAPPAIDPDPPIAPPPPPVDALQAAGPETMFVPAPDPAPLRTPSPSPTPRASGPAKRPATTPRKRRSKVKWGVAALPVAGFALWHVVPPSPPPPAPAPVRAAPVPKPVADGGPQVQVERLLAGLAKAPCTWVSAREGGGGAPLILSGAAGDRASFDQRAGGFATQAGLAGRQLDSSNVMPLPPGRCALIDALKPFDTPSAGGDRLGISASRVSLGEARPACPGGVGAQLDIWVEERDPARDFALLALDPSGSVRSLVAGRDAFRTRSQENAKAYYTNGNGRFHVAACFASTGTAGVLLVDRRGPLDLGGSREAGLPERLGALAAAQGWRVRSEWVAVETPPPGGPSTLASPSPSPEPTASTKPQPTATMAGTAPVPPADSPKGIADLRDLERSHQRQNSGVGACYSYRGAWTSLGYTSKSACVLSVFQNRCDVKNGQFDKTELRRAGGFIEERRGRKWRVILSDRRCG